MDSALAVRNGEHSVLNVNDYHISSADLRYLRKELGSVDVVLNQFAIAGYGGFANRMSSVVDQFDSEQCGLAELYNDEASRDYGRFVKGLWDHYPWLVLQSFKGIKIHVTDLTAHSSSNSPTVNSWTPS